MNLHLRPIRVGDTVHIHPDGTSHAVSRGVVFADYYDPLCDPPGTYWDRVEVANDDGPDVVTCSIAREDLIRCGDGCPVCALADLRVREMPS